MNEYHIYEEIGHGQGTVVYKGRKKKTIEHVAVKSVEKNLKDKIVREVHVMHNLDHQHVLKFVNWYETSNHVWVILEYCAGGDLVGIIRQDLKLPEYPISLFAQNILQGLQHVHSHGYIHGSLKPSNLLINEYGMLKLSGFGLSIAIPVNEDDDKQGVRRGTPFYMAPELFHPQGIQSFASDFWAFGCILFELAYGRPPFCSKSVQELVQSILFNPLPELTGATPAFAHLLSRCLAKDPLERITWEELSDCEFMQQAFDELGGLENVEMPSQPLYDKLAQEAAQASAAASAAPSSRSSPQHTARSSRSGMDLTSVDVLALTMNAQRNQLATSQDDQNEEEDEQGAEAANGAAMDQEMNFEDEKSHPDEVVEEEDEKDVHDQRVIEKVFGSDVSVSVSVQRPARASVAAHPHEEKRQQQANHPSSHQSQQSYQDNVSSSSKAPESVSQSSQSTQSSATNNHADTTASSRPSTASTVASSRPSTTDGQGRAKEPVSLQSLLMHRTDFSVRPLVGNHKIEKLPPPHVPSSAKSLGFKTLSAKDMLALDQAALEAFLTQVFRSIGGQSTATPKRIAALSYLETVAQDSQITNILINSSLMGAFIKMLRHFRAPPIKIRLLTLTGYLLRYATFIGPDLAQSGIVPVLSDLLRDSDTKTRRRAMCALGELIFYIATQQEASSESGSGNWNVPNSTITMMGRMLRSEDDVVVKHYVVKTIENVAAQCPKHATEWFGDQDILFSLFNLYSTASSSVLRACAAGAMSLLLYRHPNMLARLINRVGLNLFIIGIGNSSGVQQPFVNILNMLLKHRPPRAINLIEQNEKVLLVNMSKLMNGGKEIKSSKRAATVGGFSRLRLVLCGKAMLSLSLLADASPALLFRILPRLLNNLDQVDQYTSSRLASDNQEASSKQRKIFLYVQNCLEALRSALSEHSHPTFVAMRDTLARSSRNTNTQRQFKGLLTSIQAFSRICACSSLDRVLVTPLSIPTISEIFTLLVKANFEHKAVYESTLLSLVEASVANSSYLLSIHAPLLSVLLPALINYMSDSKEADTRFRLLQCTGDCVSTCMKEPTVYDPTVVPSAARPISSSSSPADPTAELNSLLLTRVMQLLTAVLAENDPMPQYALKLMYQFISINPGLDVCFGQTRSLLPSLLSMYESQSLQQNALRLVQLVVASPRVDSAQLYSLDIAPKVAAVVKKVIATKEESLYEAVLDTACNLLLFAVRQTERKAASDGVNYLQATEVMLTTIHTLAPFLEYQLNTCSNTPTPDQATILNLCSRCLSAMATLYPRHASFLTPHHIRVYAVALETGRRMGLVHKHELTYNAARVLYAILRSGSEELTGALRQPRSRLLSAIQRQSTCEPSATQNIAAALLKLVS